MPLPTFGPITARLDNDDQLGELIEGRESRLRRKEHTRRGVDEAVGGSSDGSWMEELLGSRGSAGVSVARVRSTSLFASSFLCTAWGLCWSSPVSSSCLGSILSNSCVGAVSNFSTNQHALWG